jgi:hypothetical protein
MKTTNGSTLSHTVVLLVLLVSLYAPSRNRTENLLIKSQFKALLLQFQNWVRRLRVATYYRKVVPQPPPKAPRSSTLSYTPFSFEVSRGLSYKLYSVAAGYLK